MIALIFGTRPDAIKVGPVKAALDAQGVENVVLCTGQHTTLLAGTPAETDLRNAESLGLASDGNVLRWLREAERALAGRLKALAPTVVAVQGDTMTALAGARAALAAGIPVAHIEAGVRSHAAEPWPEEANRVEITTLAARHYAPTSTAFGNLVAEGIDPAAILVTGNTVVSALARYSPAQPVKEPESVILVTLHRREMQHPAVVAALTEGITKSAEMFPGVKFVWPLHPAVRRVYDVAQHAHRATNVAVCQPLGYEVATVLLARALGVITDSGGLVEEAATLGVPAIIVRAVNDRPEAVEAGVARLCEVSENGVVMAAHWLVRRGMPRRASGVYGGPEAAMLVARDLATLEAR